LFRKTALVEAHQWFRNGDHPDDNVGPGKPEGSVVKFYRAPGRPRIEGGCPRCRRGMEDHGWIDDLEGGHAVCPGDWIPTGVQGEHWAIKPDIFEATYEAVT